MANRTVRVTLNAVVSNYLANMEAAAKGTKKVEQSLEQQKAASLSAAKAQGEAWTSIGQVGVRMGLLAAAGVAVAVARFAQFDKAMSEVKAATQETAENMDLLRDAAIEAGASTVFSAVEAANAIEELGKAGLTTTEIIGGGLSGALVLAAAGGIGVAEAAGYMSIAMKQFGKDGADATHISDLLAAGAGKAVGDVTDLAQALNQAGLVANGAGFSIEETTGVLAAFADAGLLGSDAGTSLKTAIIALQSPTEKAQKLMDKYNLSFYDAQGQMLGFEDIAGQLEAGLGGLQDQTRNSALAQIFGNDALRAANVLYTRGADGIKGYIDQTNDAGYAAKVAADRLDNLAGDVEQLGGAFDTALIRSGSAANDVLRDVVQSMTFLVDIVGGAPEPLLATGLAAGVVAAAILLSGGAALIAVPKYAAFKAQVALSSISMGQFALRTAAVGGAIGIATIAVGLFVSAQANAAATTNELKDSLDKSTGSLTNYSREIVAKKLAENGSFEAAKEAGVSQRELTDAVIEGGSALEAVRGKINENTQGWEGFIGMFGGAGARASSALVEIRSLSGSVVQSQKDFKDQAAALDVTTSSAGSAADAYQDAADEVSNLSGQINTLIDTINKANGVGQDAVTTNAAYEKTLADARKELAEFAKANGVSAANLDESTAAGASNAAMLADLAGSSQDAAKAQFELDGNTENYVARLGAGRKEIYDTALALTGNAKAAQALTDKIYAMPSKKEIEILADTKSAEDDLRRLTSRWQGKTINLTTAVSGKLGSGILGKATGGILPGSPSRKDNMLIAAASGEFVTNAASSANPANRAALEYMNNGGSIANYAQPTAPMYASSGGGGASVMNITVPVTVNTLAADNPDMFARAVAAGVQTGIRNGSIPADWNKG